MKQPSYEEFLRRRSEAQQIDKAVRFHQSDQLEKAEKIYREILETNPHNADALHLLGLIKHQAGYGSIAVAYITKALGYDSENPIYHNNLGSVLMDQQELDKAISHFFKAIDLKQDFPEPYNNAGVVLKERGKTTEAISYFERALALKSDFAEALSNFAHLLQQTCEWDKLELVAPELDRLTEKGLQAETEIDENPFVSIMRHPDPALNFAVAKSYSSQIARDMSSLDIRFSFDERKSKRAKIHVGYISNNFQNHPVSHLTLSLFGLHNRDDFKIFCYSYGKDDGTDYRRQIEEDCDKFTDLTRHSHVDAARTIYRDEIDILVDLTGYTDGNRFAICALRPAPVQINYIGFMGTTGADFIDYVITDRIVTPEDQAIFYSEKFVYMPHCYQVNDHTQAISSNEWKRTDLGLPEETFVFCSFNEPYKIEPDTFDIWMQILRLVPKSVMWLSRGNKTVETNLCREAESRGVNPERLVFADRMHKDQHLSRMKHADLALDTRVYNGGATTSNTLWAGVPLVTLKGTHFVSRMSSSILNAIGLPELVSRSPEEYVTLAVRLALNPDELQAVRIKLAKNRLYAPLFDTPRFCINLERAYMKMWEIFQAGKNRDR